MPALIILGKVHFLLMSENEFFPGINVTELQAFMEFTKGFHNLAGQFGGRPIK